MNLEPGQLGRSRAFADVDRHKGSLGRGMLRARFICLLMALDAISIFAGFLGANILLGRGADESQWLLSLAATMPIYLMVAINSNAYSVSKLQSRFNAAKIGARAILIAAAAIVLVAFCLKVSTNFSRLTMFIGISGSMIFIIVARYLFVGFSENILGGKTHITILLEDGLSSVSPGEHLFLNAAAHDLDPDSDDPHMYDRLAKALRPADRVIVNCLPERRESWARALKGANIRSEIIVPELNALIPLGQSWHQGAPTVVVANGPLRLVDRIIKRAFDVAVASGTLIILLPALVATALLIKLDSPGPIFFVQTRIGRGNEQFRLLKFRSMRQERADSHGLTSASRDDDRVTRIGRFLRMTSVDELPQLLNVLKGDMSIVGPRPHALGSRAANKLFWEIDERYWHRHAAKPGLTGLAQIRGYRGATHLESDLVNRLQADLEYLDHWSLLKDIWILCRTVRVVLHPNAY